jgi:hypothetical protein
MVAIACTIAFYFIHVSWLMFAVMFLVPDLSIAFYLTGPRIGSAGYNAAHCYIGILLVLAGRLSGWHAGDAVSLIWAAHIGLTGRWATDSSMQALSLTRTWDKLERLLAGAPKSD